MNLFDFIRRLFLKTATKEGGANIGTEERRANLGCADCNRGCSACCKSCGVSETTIRARLNDPDFRAQYEKAKSEILTEACDALSARLTSAVDALYRVLDDDSTPATVKVSAADAILRHGLRYVETANIIRRLDALENGVTHEGL